VEHLTRQDHGEVKRSSPPTDIKGHHVAASEDNPEYLVESDKTGKKLLTSLMPFKG